MRPSTETFVRSPFSNRVFNSLKHLMETPYIKGSNKNAVLSGESGNGKTAILTQFTSMHPEVITPSRTLKPVVYVEMMTFKTERQLYATILKSIGAPSISKSENANILLDKIKNFVLLCEIKLLILDEVQTVFQNRALSQLSDICDWFKRLIEYIEIPVVLGGMPWLPKIIDDFEQLKTRMGYRFTVPNYTFSEGFGNYCAFVKTYFKSQGLDTAKILEDHAFYTRLFAFSSGNVRATTSLLMDLFKERPTIAQLNSSKKVAECISNTGIEDEKNPFLVPIQELVIKEIASASDWNFKASRHVSHSTPPCYRHLKLTKKEQLILLESTQKAA